jgi:hypothetical protein
MDKLKAHILAALFMVPYGLFILAVYLFGGLAASVWGAIQNIMEEYEGSVEKYRRRY